MSEAVILCEGFYDRAFWAGWLEHLGCPKPVPGRVFDPAGKLVSGGQFGFYSPTGSFIRAVPCGGKERVLPEARACLEGRRIDSLRHLVLCVDPDVTTASEGGKTGLRAEDIQRLVRETVGEVETNADGDLSLDGGSTIVSLVRWETNGDTHAGVPAQQTLERLVCAVITAVYPNRGPAVQKWLNERPEAPELTPKEFAWSHMAGYAGRGCENFFRAVWEDVRLVSELETQLNASGAWRVAESLVA